MVYEAAPKVALEPVKNLLVEWDPVEANVKKSKSLLYFNIFCSVNAREKKKK